ncbi:MAG: VOC family protein [Chitinophagaceae bacterium]|nr:VOC family protein [Chitinophagaceae bacterium]
MSQQIAHIALLVNDYDKTIKFYKEKLNFVIIEDTALSENKRWVLIAPKNNADEIGKGCCLLLAAASNDEQRSRIGNQTGGRVFLFLYTDNFQKDFMDMQEKGIKFIRQPVKEKWGTVAVFEDLYGNLWDLIERV